MSNHPSHPDHRPRKGRGATLNMPGRFAEQAHVREDDGWGSLDEPLPPLATVVQPEAVRSIVSRNDSPDIPFTQSINPYRGCEHGCVYCVDGDTPILYADGTQRPIRDARVGDVILGTVRAKGSRRYVPTRILDHWQTRKPAYRIRLVDGTQIVASGDHRFLTEAGWKFVAAAAETADERLYLRANDRLIGPGGVAVREPFTDCRLERGISESVRIVSLEALGHSTAMYDITTGTEDFIANGVVSHNCYARPSHAYVDLSPGLDFETRLFYKKDAATRLRETFRKPTYQVSPITIGGNTDPYQPIEREYRVTRELLEVMRDFRHPLTLITKGAGVLRDLDLLADLAGQHLVQVMISITSLDAEIKRTLEPRTAGPAARLKAVRTLADAGIPTGVMVAPIIPAITDHEIERIVAAAADARAARAGYVMLRLPHEVKTLFRAWLDAHYPDRAGRVMKLVREMRGGQDYDSRFGTRLRGEGPYANLIAKRFAAACRRNGLPRATAALRCDLFERPAEAGDQMGLF